MLAEVVVVKADPAQPMFGQLGEVTSAVVVNRDPDSGGILTLTTTTPVGQGMALHYEVNTSPTDVTVSANSSRSDTIGAPDHPTVNYVAIYPDPEPVLDT